jgi:hypothetical protein
MITANLQIVTGFDLNISAVGGVVTMMFNVSMPSGATVKELAVSLSAEEPNMFELTKVPKAVWLYTVSESGAKRPLNLDYSFLNKTINVSSPDDYANVIIAYI